MLYANCIVSCVLMHDMRLHALCSVCLYLCSQSPSTVLAVHYRSHRSSCVGLGTKLLVQIGSYKTEQQQMYSFDNCNYTLYMS